MEEVLGETCEEDYNTTNLGIIDINKRLKLTVTSGKLNGNLFKSMDIQVMIKDAKTYFHVKPKTCKTFASPITLI